MKTLKNNLIFFLIGAIGYGLIEIIWRGYTHWSMLTLGGICFSFFAKISSALKNYGILYKAVISGLFITAAEFIYGLIFNVYLKKNIWNYSNIPFNFMGQICILYSVFWCILSIVFIPVADKLNYRLQK